MTTRSRLLVPLLALALAAPAGPTLAQSGDGSRTMGDVIADALEDLAREIGSAQDEIRDLAEDIDPSDPEAPIDPSDPDSPIDPTDPEAPIDPSDPEGDPGAPAEPEDTAPGESEGDEAGDEIEVPEPSEPEEGGYAEIQLLPEPPPRAGGWRVVNHPGTMTCTGAGSLPLKRSVQQTTIAVRDDGRVLRGTSLAPGQRGGVKLTWQPDSEAYTGVVKVAAPGGKTRITFYLRVVSPRKMKGEMVATTTVNAQGVRGACAGTRRITLTKN